MFNLQSQSIINIKQYLKLYLFLLAIASFTGCKKDNEAAQVLPKPTIDKVEIGLSNNEIGVIGKDFHLNAEVLAGDKIESVQVKIQQRSGEAYAKVWSHEITYVQYKDAKNATIHKHFDIPADAAEGKYDFLIIVNDQNGSKLEEKRTLNIYAEANLPVNPTLSVFSIMRQSDVGFFYRQGVFSQPGAKLNKQDILSMQATISGVKGDGKMYILLINKKLNHRPETTDRIDFSKVIVYDVFEHKNWAAVGHFSNSVFDITTNTTTRSLPYLTIGATIDNNAPQFNPINGVKAWESGDYYFGVVYKNTTYNMSFYHYVEVPIEIN